MVIVNTNPPWKCHRMRVRMRGSENECLGRGECVYLHVNANAYWSVHVNEFEEACLWELE